MLMGCFCAGGRVYGKSVFQPLLPTLIYFLNHPMVPGALSIGVTQLVLDFTQMESMHVWLCI